MSQCTCRSCEAKRAQERESAAFRERHGMSKEGEASLLVMAWAVLLVCGVLPLLLIIVSWGP